MPRVREGNGTRGADVMHFDDDGLIVRYLVNGTGTDLRTSPNAGPVPQPGVGGWTGVGWKRLTVGTSPLVVRA